MFRATALAAVVTLVTGASTAGAQDAVLSELYGRAVHRYFALDYDQAYQDLTLAIDSGLRDPRAYYFRGLAASAMGRTDEAAADWQQGATLEARGNFSGSIGRALARIQGPCRIALERTRQLAQLEERNRQAAQSRARYEALEAAEPRVLRGVTPAPAPPAPPEPQPAAPPEPEPAAPAAPTPAAPTPPAAVDPLDATRNPFTDDPGMAIGDPTLESENALGDPLSQPAPAPAAPAEAPPAEGATEPAPADDPFGGAFGTGDAEEASPFGADDAAEDNPFGL